MNYWLKWSSIPPLKTTYETLIISMFSKIKLPANTNGISGNALHTFCSVKTPFSSANLSKYSTYFFFSFLLSICSSKVLKAKVLSTKIRFHQFFSFINLEQQIILSICRYFCSYSKKLPTLNCRSLTRTNHMHLFSSSFSKKCPSIHFSQIQFSSILYSI